MLDFGFAPEPARELARTRRSSKRPRWLIAAALGLLLASCVTASPGKGDLAARASTGDLSARPDPTPRTLSPARGYVQLKDGTKAVVFVPASYRPDHPAALALLLHGAGGRGGDMVQLFRRQAEARGIILVAPDSNGASWDVVLSFDAGRASGARPQFGADVGRIDTALARVFADYAVDPAKIAVIGVSDGAGYALALGGNNAGLLRNIIALSPGFMMPIHNPARSRVFLAHGLEDRMLPASVTSSELAPAFKGLGFDVTLLLYTGGHEWPASVINQALDWYLPPAR